MWQLLSNRHFASKDRHNLKLIFSSLSHGKNTMTANLPIDSWIRIFPYSVVQNPEMLQINKQILISKQNWTSFFHHENVLQFSLTSSNPESVRGIPVQNASSEIHSILSSSLITVFNTDGVLYRDIAFGETDKNNLYGNFFPAEWFPSKEILSVFFSVKQSMTFTSPRTEIQQADKHFFYILNYVPVESMIILTTHGDA